MESTDPVRVEAAYQYLTAHLPAESVVPYQPDSVARAEEAVQDIITGKGPDPSLQLPVSNAYQVYCTQQAAATAKRTEIISPTYRPLLLTVRPAPGNLSSDWACAFGPDVVFSFATFLL